MSSYGVVITNQAGAPLVSSRPSNERDWRVWLKEMFPMAITRPFAPHQAEYWDWLWKIEVGKPHPDVDAFFKIFPREGGKTTGGQLGVVALGARQKRRYGWLLSRTQSQANDKLLEIRTAMSRLAGSKFAAAYPGMANVKKDENNHSLGWRATRLYTEDGFIMDAIGLETATRGAKVDFQRPDFLVIDDIDHKLDSALVIEKNVHILTYDILPAGSQDLIVLGLQNLIIKNGIFGQIADGRAKYLKKRRIAGGGPVKALRNFQFEESVERLVITSGEPTWPGGQDVEACERLLNRIGPSAFLVECQHEVDLPIEGAIFPMWDERASVITWDEFADYFGSIARDRYGRPRIPERWLKARALDKGTTIGHPSGSIHIARPTQVDKLNDTVFCYRELVYPEYPFPESMDISPMFVGKKIRDSERPWGETFEISLMSHEATDWQNTFLMDMPEGYRLSYAKWKPNRQAGIGQLQNYMTVIQKDRLNPFRPQFMGRSRLVCLVDNAQGDAYRDADGAWRVKGAVDAKGFARLRAEIPQYHLPHTLDGEEREQTKKIFDDMIDPLRALAEVFFVNSRPMSLDEKVEAALAPQYAKEAIAAIEDRTLQDAMLMGRQMQEAMTRRRLEREEYSGDSIYSHARRHG